MAPKAIRQSADKENSLFALGSNQSGMRVHNERLVLTILRRHGPMAKSDLARAAGLSAQTVSVIMRALEDEGLLVRGDPVRGKVGQPSIPMRLAPDGAFFLGVKVGRRSVEMVLTNFLGRVLDRRLRTHDFPTPEATLTFVHDMVDALLDTIEPSQRARMAGMGVAMPFFLWNWAKHLGVPDDQMSGWRDFDLRDELAEHYDFPIFLQNDGSAACGAEVVFGPHDGPDDFLYFYVGYFIGGGVVLDGTLYTGHGNSGAMGPLPVPDGQGGTCTLIERASLSVLETCLKADGHKTDEMWRNADIWHIDPTHLRAWVDKAAHALAHAIVSSCATVDFETIRIDGWLPRTVLQDLVTTTQAALDDMDVVGLIRPKIQCGSVGPDARALGAASLPLSKRFLID